MPDIPIPLTLGQAQRVSASFGPKPANLSHEEWIVKNTRSFYRERVKAAESQTAGNTAHDAAVAQAEADFAGF